MNMTRLGFLKGLFCLPAIALLPKVVAEAKPAVKRIKVIWDGRAPPLRCEWKWKSVKDVNNSKIGNFQGTFEIFPRPFEEDPFLKECILMHRKKCPEVYAGIPEIV